MNRRIIFRVTVSIILALVVGILPAYGGVIVTATEIGGDVVFTGSGTLDTTALVFDLSGTTSGFVRADVGMVLGSGDFDAYLFTTPSSFGGPGSFGTGVDDFTATSETGDVFGLDFTFLNLGVPAGYVSGSPLSGSATFAGESFASLGITPGNYEWTWSTVTGTDSFTLQAIPEPSTFALAVFSIMSLPMVRWRQHNKG